MGHDQKEVELLATRVEKAIHRSQELIRESRMLEVRTTGFLNQWNSEPEFDGYRGVRTQPDLGIEDVSSSLKRVVNRALQITGADMANLQLIDPVSGDLNIVAQNGFQRPFLDFFECVHENEAACGTACKRGGRVIVEDVTQSPIFYGTAALEVLLDAGVRAVQSTPLIACSGFTVGVLSTHWSSPYRPRDRDLFALDLLATKFSDRWDQRDYLLNQERLPTQNRNPGLG
jgi:hypothetical protein